MKIHRKRPGDDDRPGFVNVGSDAEIEAVAEDAEVTELVAVDVLDFSPDRLESLAFWAGKLRRGGTLVVGGLDLLSVSLRVARRQLDADGASRLLHQGGRRSSASLESMAGHLTSLGLEVIHRRPDGPYYTITARRP